MRQTLWKFHRSSPAKDCELNKIEQFFVSLVQQGISLPGIFRLINPVSRRNGFLGTSKLIYTLVYRPTQVIWHYYLVWNPRSWPNLYSMTGIRVEPRADRSSTLVFGKRLDFLDLLDFYRWIPKSTDPPRIQMRPNCYIVLLQRSFYSALSTLRQLKAGRAGLKPHRSFDFFPFRGKPKTSCIHDSIFSLNL